MKKQYLEVSQAEKLELLNKHACVGPKWKTLADKMWCLHCGIQFTGESVRVYQEGRDPSVWLECGTPGCDGSPIDWAEYPWWDDSHPSTQARDKLRDALEKEEPRDPGHN